MQKNISVVLSADNPPDILKKVLLGYNTQTYRNFEVLLACNGNKAVKELVKQLEAELFYSLTCIEEDVEKAVEAAVTDYIIMSCGNCIPRADFVEQHVKYREEGFFVTGGATEISKSRAGLINKENLYTGAGFNTYSSIFNSGFVGSLLNRVIPASSKWNNYNVSAWKKDILMAMKVQGKILPKTGDELVKQGIKAKQIGFSAVCLCLSS